VSQSIITFDSTMFGRILLLLKYQKFRF